MYAALGQNIETASTFKVGCTALGLLQVLSSPILYLSSRGDDANGLFSSFLVRLWRLQDQLIGCHIAQAATTEECFDSYKPDARANVPNMVDATVTIYMQPGETKRLQNQSSHCEGELNYW